MDTGTDFLIRSFKTMDSGVYVYAAADGYVSVAEDGHYDRMKELVTTARPNYIRVIHKDKLSTYYYHLRKGSILVKIGDTVKAGQPIGMVGSSGYSTGPHLHFEVRDSNKAVIDPFIGGCSFNRQQFWIDPPPYDKSVFLIEDGFIPYVPKFDALQERLLVGDTFYIHKDTTVCHWVAIHGVQKGDTVISEWYGPTGILWSTYSYINDDNEAYHYSWHYMKLPPFKGKWTSKFFVHNKLVANRCFYVLKQKKGG